MLSRAMELPALAYGHLDTLLERFKSHTMMPLYFVPGLDDFTFSQRPFTDLTYTDALYYIIRLLVPDPVGCLTAGDVRDIENATLNDIVNITNTIYAISRNLVAIEDTLLAVRHHNLTDECYQKVIRGGVPTQPDLGNVMCPVCSEETAATRACRSTCINTVRGCFADVTSIIPLYEELLRKMDGLHLSLKFNMISRLGALSRIRFSVRQQLSLDTLDKCVTDNPFSGGYRDSGNYLFQEKKYYSVTKGLSGVLNTPDKEPCSLSEQATQRCWNGRSQDTGYDNSYPVQFSEQAQLNNPVLPYQRYSAQPIETALQGVKEALDFTVRCERLDHVLALPSTMSLFDETKKSGVTMATLGVLFVHLFFVVFIFCE
eukprot:sb/3465785/